METIQVELHRFRLYSDGNRYYVDCNYWDQGYVLPDQECIEIDAASFAISTLDPIINESTIINLDLTTFTLTTFVGGVNDIVAIETYVFALTTNDPKINLILRPDKATYVLLPQVAGINDVIAVDAASFTLITNDPSIDQSVIPDTTTFNLVTNDPSVSDSVIPDPAQFTLLPQAVSINEAEVISVDAASFTLVTLAASVNDIVYIDERVNFFFDRQGVTIIEVNVALKNLDINKLPPTVNASTIINISGLKDTSPPELPFIAARTSQSDASANSVPVTLPTHSAGQLLVAFVAEDNNGGVPAYDISAEGGRNGWFSNNVVTLSGSDAGLSVLWKVAESASESLTLYMFQARATKTVVYAIQNANDLYLNSDNNFFGTDSSAFFNPVSLEQEHACLMFGAVAGVDDAIITAPSTGYTIEDTIQGGVSFDSSLSVQSKQAYLNTSEQPDGATLSVTQGWCSFTVAAINRDPNETTFRRRFNFNDRNEFFNGNGNIDNEWTEGDLVGGGHSITQTTGATSGLDEGFLLVRTLSNIADLATYAGYIEWTGTFEDLGVTAGSTIDGYGTASIWYRAYDQSVAPDGTAQLGATITGGYDAVEVTDDNGTYTLIPATAQHTTDTGWIQVSGSPVSTAAPLASNTTVTIRVYTEFDNDNAGNIRLDFDDLFLNVQVTPAESVRSGFDFNTTDTQVNESNFIVVDLLEFNLVPLVSQALGFLDIRDEVQGTAASPVTLPAHEADDLLLVFWAANRTNLGSQIITIVESGWEYVESVQSDTLMVVAWKKATSNSETLDLDHNERDGLARTSAYSVIGGIISSPPDLDVLTVTGIVPDNEGMFAGDLTDSFSNQPATIAPAGQARYFKAVEHRPAYENPPVPTVVDGPYATSDTESYVFTTSPTNSVDMGVTSSTDPVTNLFPEEFPETQRSREGAWIYDRDMTDFNFGITANVTVGLNIIFMETAEFNLATYDEIIVSPDERVEVDNVPAFALGLLDTINDIEIDLLEITLTANPAVTDPPIVNGITTNTILDSFNHSVTLPAHSIGDLLVVFSSENSRVARPNQDHWKQLYLERYHAMYYKIAESASETFSITYTDFVRSASLHAYSISNANDFEAVRRVAGVNPPENDTGAARDYLWVAPVTNRFGTELGTAPPTGYTGLNATSVDNTTFTTSYRIAGDPVEDPDAYTWSGAVQLNFTSTFTVGFFQRPDSSVRRRFFHGYIEDPPPPVSGIDKVSASDTGWSGNDGTFVYVEPPSGQGFASSTSSYGSSPNSPQSTVFRFVWIDASDNAGSGYWEWTGKLQDLGASADQSGTNIDEFGFDYYVVDEGVAGAEFKLADVSDNGAVELIVNGGGSEWIVPPVADLQVTGTWQEINEQDVSSTIILPDDDITLRIHITYDGTAVPSSGQDVDLYIQQPRITVAVASLVEVDTLNFNLTTYDIDLDVKVNIDLETFTLVPNGVQESNPIGLLTFNLNTLQTKEVIDELTTFTLTTEDARINESEIIAIDLLEFNLNVPVAGVGDVVALDLEAFMLYPSQFFVNDVVGTDPPSLDTEMNLIAWNVQANSKDIVVIDAAISFALTPQEPTVEAETFIEIVPAPSFTLTTNEFLVNDIIAIDVVSFTLTTQLPSIDVDLILDAESFTLTPALVNIKLPINIDATVDFDLQTLTAGVNEVIPVEAATLSLSTQDATINERYIEPIDAASLTLVTQQPNINVSIILDAEIQFTLTTTETRVNNAELIFIDLATITLVPQVSGVNEIVVIDTASLNLQTQDAVINEQFRVLMDSASFALTAYDVTVNAEFIVFVDTALLTLTTNASVTNEQFIVFVDTLALTLTPLLANAKEVQLIPLTEFNVTTNDVVVNEEFQVMVDTATFSLNTIVAGINEIVPVDAAALDLVTQDAIINARFVEPIDLGTIVLVTLKGGINDILVPDTRVIVIVPLDTDFDSTLEAIGVQVVEGGWKKLSETYGTANAVINVAMSSTTTDVTSIDTNAEVSWSVPVVEFN